MIPLPAQIDDGERALLRRAEAFHRREFSAGLCQADLRRVNRDFGVDFATAVLYAHFASRVPASWLGVESDEPSARRAVASLAIIPGAFYREYPHLGSDGRAVAELAAARGWGCEVLPAQSLGTLRENAEAVIRWFDECSARDLIVVAISKGAADLKVALAQRPDLWGRIRGWICVSGILCGTPIANWLLERKRLWLTTRCVLWYWKLPASSLAELRHDGFGSDAQTPLQAACERPDAGGARERPRFPDPIQIVGFPLRRHLSSWRSRLWHRRLRNHGPNDGVIWLEDLLRQPATVVPVWGADHYLRASRCATELLGRIIDSLPTPAPSCGAPAKVNA